MLRERSIVEIADNSGAVRVMLFAVNGQNRRRSVSVGDVVMGSVKKASVGGKIKKGQKVAVLLTATRRKISRKDGTSIRFSRNLGVVVKKGKDRANLFSWERTARETLEVYKSVYGMKT